MRIALAFVAGVLIAGVVIVAFPGSAAAVVVGWSIYLFIGLVMQPWGIAMLALGMAIAAVWWTLTRPVE